MPTPYLVTEAVFLHDGSCERLGEHRDQAASNERKQTTERDSAHRQHDGSDFGRDGGVLDRQRRLRLLGRRLAVRHGEAVPPVFWIGHADALDPMRLHPAGGAVEEQPSKLVLQIGLHVQEFELKHLGLERDGWEPSTQRCEPRPRWRSRSSPDWRRRALRAREDPSLYLEAASASAMASSIADDSRTR